MYLSCHGSLFWTRQAVCEENMKTTKNADLIRQRLVLLFVLQLVYQKPLSNQMCGLCQRNRGWRRTAQRGEQYKCFEDVPVFISSFPRTNSFSCSQCCCSMFSDDGDFLNEESGKSTRSWKLCRASCSLHDGAGSGPVRPLGAGHKCRDGSIEKKALVLVLFIITLYVLDQVFQATDLIVCWYQCWEPKDEKSKCLWQILRAVKYSENGNCSFPKRNVAWRSCLCSSPLWLQIFLLPHTQSSLVCLNEFKKKIISGFHTDFQACVPWIEHFGNPGFSFGWVFIYYAEIHLHQVLLKICWLCVCVSLLFFLELQPFVRCCFNSFMFYVLSWL